jgi:hypothetical protein
MHLAVSTHLAALRLPENTVLAVDEALDVECLITRRMLAIEDHEYGLTPMPEMSRLEGLITNAALLVLLLQFLDDLEPETNVIDLKIKIILL